MGRAFRLLPLLLLDAPCLGVHGVTGWHPLGRGLGRGCGTPGGFRNTWEDGKMGKKPGKILGKLLIWDRHSNYSVYNLFSCSICNLFTTHLSPDSTCVSILVGVRARFQTMTKLRLDTPQSAKRFFFTWLACFPLDTVMHIYACRSHLVAQVASITYQSPFLALTVLVSAWINESTSKVTKNNSSPRLVSNTHKPPQPPKSKDIEITIS